MSKRNVLVLSAGRRVELVIAFQEALKENFPDSQVFTTDLQPQLSAACQISDKWFQAPRVTSAGYIEYLKKICAEYNVGLVVPTIDTELLLLADQKSEFEKLGIFLIISSPALVSRCRDKRKTAELFDQLNIECPKIYKRDRIQFPCFCKPYDGSCSIGACALSDRKMLTQDLLNNEKNIFMELVDDEYVEYTIDAYYDVRGVLSCLVPRERIEVRGGEVSKGATRKNQVYDYLRSRLCDLHGAVGCITVQVFFNPTTGMVKGLEINPRFGGGYPLSHYVGANYPEWLIKEYFLGDKIRFYDSWESDVVMLRYDAKVIVRDTN